VGEWSGDLGIDTRFHISSSNARKKGDSTDAGRREAIVQPNDIEQAGHRSASALPQNVQICRFFTNARD
jgi:hypothetical protein